MQIGSLVQARRLSFRGSAELARSKVKTGVYVTTILLVIYCFGPTDRKTKWGRFVCGNMFPVIMIKDHELASSGYIRV